MVDLIGAKNIIPMFDTIIVWLPPVVEKDLHKQGW